MSLDLERGEAWTLCWAPSSFPGPSHILFHFTFRKTLGSKDSYCSHLADEGESEVEQLVTWQCKNSHLVHSVWSFPHGTRRHPTSHSAPLWPEINCLKFIFPSFFLSLFLKRSPRKNPTTPANPHSLKSLAQRWRDARGPRRGISSLCSISMVQFYNLIMKQKTNKPKKCEERVGEIDVDAARSEEFTDPQSGPSQEMLATGWAS